MIPNNPPVVLVLFGPTASGKTKVLLELFNSAAVNSEIIGSVLQAEVVSADSMQVYRGMDIGTAKPSIEEQARLPHHLINIIDPREQFNAGDFVRLADEACMEIAGRGKLPVVSGGTGFYLKNFIMGLSEAPPSSEEIRAALKKELRDKGAQTLMDELAAVDPISAGRIHINDEYRLLRALEVWRVCGRALSSFKAPTVEKCTSQTSSLFPREKFRFIIVGLSMPRDELYRRINLRCENMFNQGLADEVRRLYEAGYSPNDPGLRAIGYREFFIEDSATAVDKPCEWKLSHDIEGVKFLIMQNSRRYAKRQLTFFAGIPRIHTRIHACIHARMYAGVKWIECGKDEAETAQRIKEHLKMRSEE